MWVRQQRSQNPARPGREQRYGKASVALSARMVAVLSHRVFGNGGMPGATHVAFCARVMA